MQFDNLFGYEEQQQQQQIQPQQVEAVNGYINQLIPSQIKSSNSKRGKKQNPKLNQFKQIMCLNPKSKAKIQKKNQKKAQVQNNHLDRVYPFHREMLFKIQENSEELKGVLSQIDNIIKKQQQEFDENKKFLSIGFHTMQNCLVGSLMQFQQLRLYFPDLVINYKTPQSNLNFKQGQDYVNLDKILKCNQAQLPEIKFSETYKNESIKLDKFRISAQSKLSGYSICELPLYKQAIQKFAFKINKLNGNIAIGVCNKDILAQQNYQPNNPINTQDLYLLQNNGEVYPNQEKEMQQGQPFEFQQSNYIVLIVNFQKQYIKWIKNNHNQEFSMNFNIKDDVYPCVLFSYYQTAVNKLQQITIMKPKTLEFQMAILYLKMNEYMHFEMNIYQLQYSYLMPLIYMQIQKTLALFKLELNLKNIFKSDQFLSYLNLYLIDLYLQSKNNKRLESTLTMQQSQIQLMKTCIYCLQYRLIKVIQDQQNEFQLGQTLLQINKLSIIYQHNELWQVKQNYKAYFKQKSYKKEK